MEKLIRFFKDEEGATAVEYGLIVALIAAVIVAGCRQRSAGRSATAFQTHRSLLCNFKGAGNRGRESDVPFSASDFPPLRYDRFNREAEMNSSLQLAWKRHICGEAATVRRGATSVEYAILGSLIAAVIALVVFNLGSQVRPMFETATKGW